MHAKENSEMTLDWQLPDVYEAIKIPGNINYVGKYKKPLL